MRQSFFFVTSEVEFQESTKKGARISVTLMELNTPSRNNRIYRIEEGASLAKSLIGKSIRYGADWLGKHVKKAPVIGEVENAWQKGKKILGTILIWGQPYFDQIKQGIKFLFSVGGMAQFGETIKKGKKIFTRLYNPICTHLQMLPNKPDEAGFPTAKMHKVLEINESVILAEPETIKLCDMMGCRILKGIRIEYEEAKVIAAAEEKAINMAILEDIARITEIIMKEPWLFIESKN